MGDKVVVKIPAKPEMIKIVIISRSGKQRIA